MLLGGLALGWFGSRPVRRSLVPVADGALVLLLLLIGTAPADAAALARRAVNAWGGAPRKRWARAWWGLLARGGCGVEVVVRVTLLVALLELALPTLLDVGFA